MGRLLEHIGPLLCILGGVCFLSALAVDLDSTAAKLLMAAGVALFVPGALLALGRLRYRLGPPT